MSVKQTKIKKKRETKSSILTHNIILSSVVSICVYVVLLSISAIIVMNTDIKPDTYAYIYLGICALTSFAGSFVICRAVKKKKMIMAFISSFIILILVFTPIIIADNASMSASALILLPSVFLPAVISALISKK